MLRLSSIDDTYRCVCKFSRQYDPEPQNLVLIRATFLPKSSSEVYHAWLNPLRSLWTVGLRQARVSRRRSSWRRYVPLLRVGGLLDCRGQRGVTSCEPVALPYKQRRFCIVSGVDDGGDGEGGVGELRPHTKTAAHMSHVLQHSLSRQKSLFCTGVAACAHPTLACRDAERTR